VRAQPASQVEARFTPQRPQTLAHQRPTTGPVGGIDFVD
jgi:hypothetical protein